MNRIAKNNRTRSSRLIGLALTTALAGVSLTGCSTSSASPAAHSASDAEAALAKGEVSSAVKHAEAAVLADPRNADYRATLGAAYLDAGRFASSATAYGDAIELGETSPRAQLSLALSLAANGRGREAVIVLDEAENQLSASDLGLAYSLAGATQRGIYVLTAALRSGENTMKVRQNLAYSYALAGRWREARLMAAEDVPADKLGDRMSEWAVMSHPLAHRERIASLLDVPVAREDPGQPSSLALSNFPTADQLAAEAATPEAVPSPAVMALSAPAPAAKAAPVQPNAELAPASQPAQASLTAHEYDMSAYDAPEQETFDTAFNEPAPAPTQAAAVPTPAATHTPRPAPKPATKPALAHADRAPSAATAVRTDTSRFAQPSAASSKAETHLVQLGSFLSEASAKRAWKIYMKRYPELRDHQMVITQAVVGGKHYWRVSAAGYDAHSSRAMCGHVRNSSGDGCFAYAKGSPLPGAIDTGRRLASL